MDSLGTTHEYEDTYANWLILLYGTWEIRPGILFLLYNNIRIQTCTVFLARVE